MSPNTTDSTGFDAFDAEDLLLSSLHYEVLRLWAITDLSHREIADELKTSAGTVHQYVTRRISKTEEAEMQAEKAETTVEFLVAVEEIKRAE